MGFTLQASVHVQIGVNTIMLTLVDAHPFSCHIDTPYLLTLPPLLFSTMAKSTKVSSPNFFIFSCMETHF